MERIAKVLIVLVVCLLAGMAFAAETVTVTDQYVFEGNWSKPMRVIAWSYEAGDAVTITETDPVYHVTGEIMGWQNIPTSGASNPAVGGDLILTNATSGVTEDFLNGYGMDNAGGRRRGIVDVSGTTYSKTLYDETIYFRANDIGAGKAGTFKVFIKVP